MTRLDLPEPDTPVTQVNVPSGNSTSMCLQVVFRRTAKLSGTFRCPPAASAGTRNLFCAGQVLARDGARRGDDIVDACRAATISPPCTPAPGPTSTMKSAARMVSSSCSTTRTVLPMSRRRLQRVEQLVVVALVQADGRLVEDIQNAHEARADLRGQPDALALAAGERGRGARDSVR